MTIKMATKPNAVVAAVGDHSLHRNWIPAEGSSYDIHLIYYGNDKNYAADAKTCLFKKGTKFHLVDDAADELRLDQYNYVWMPDDDIYATPAEIEAIFKTAKKYDLWLCQPSLIGWYGLEVTLHHRGNILRYTNYVEIMCPCFSRHALNVCRKTFKENRTGWGIDAVWNVLLGHPTNRIAVIDDTIVVHTRPIGGGDMYRNNANNVDDAMAEAEAVYVKYDLAKENYEDLKNGRATSQESFHTLYFNHVEYGRVHKSVEAGVDVRSRLWPPSHIIEKLCKDIRA